jgi:methyltransferase-like protein/2-polyprenyl-3-methyl-5-hydroxy-6-metoxy-1,4-benzoquinol methylase
MNETPVTRYDEVPYPSRAHIATHPDRLATVAALLGVKTAPIEHCRVLEIACGAGTNLLSMAYGLPGSEFLGVDVAASPIATGCRMVADLELSNIRFECRDLMEFEGAGPFDYIIAHGVYSWVPAPVRDRILAVCAEQLAPNGVAFVSYNAYPGCHIRDMARNMMLYHVRDIEDSVQKVAQGRALLQFLASSKNETDLYRMMLEKELALPEEYYSDGGFYHDALNPESHPVYFHEFVGHAAEHGLQFLAEANFNEFDPGEYTPATMATLRELERDPIAREQYIDFLMCRRFRRTILCRSGIEVDHRIRPGSVADLHASSRAQPVAEDFDIASSRAEVFKTKKDASVETNSPLHKAALWHLSRRWPQAIPFPDLLAAARAASSPQTGDETEQTQALCDLLLRTYAAGVIELHAWAPPIVTEVSERPVASALARIESRSKRQVTTLRHTVLELADPVSRQLLGRLDGTLDHAGLVEAMVAFVLLGGTDLVRDGETVTDPAEIRATIETGLRGALETFAREGVLVG